MQERAIKTKSAIFESALILFSKKGYSGTTIDDIASLAKVNKQRIYNYFKSKQDLFNIVLRHAFEQTELFSNATIKRAQSSPKDLTKILLDGFMKLHKENPTFWRMLSWANLEPDLDLSYLSDVRKSNNESIKAIFEDAKSKKLIRDISFENYLFTLLAVSFFYYSNEKTLIYSLGSSIFEKSGSDILNEQLNKIFT